MDPDRFRNYKRWVVNLPAHIPLEHQDPSPDDEMSNLEQLPDSVAMPPPPPPMADWTVDGVSAVRGFTNLFRPASMDSCANGSNASLSTPPADLPMVGDWEISPSQNFSTDNMETIPIVTGPHPAVSMPTLEFDFHMSVYVNPQITIGPSPAGFRKWVSLVSGYWSGTFGRGRVIPRGQDTRIIVTDGREKLECDFMLQTIDDEPAYIAAKAVGWRDGPPSDDSADSGQADDQYTFKLMLEMMTNDARYIGKVNHALWVAHGVKSGVQVVYDAYRVR